MRVLLISLTLAVAITPAFALAATNTGHPAAQSPSPNEPPDPCAQIHSKREHAACLCRSVFAKPEPERSQYIATHRWARQCRM